LDGGVLDFITIGRKRKGKEYSWNILEFEYSWAEVYVGGNCSHILCHIKQQ
jgi:hypothetical protein